MRWRAATRTPARGGSVVHRVARRRRSRVWARYLGVGGGQSRLVFFNARCCGLRSSDQAQGASTSTAHARVSSSRSRVFGLAAVPRSAFPPTRPSPPLAGAPARPPARPPPSWHPRRPPLWLRRRPSSRPPSWWWVAAWPASRPPCRPPRRAPRGCWCSTRAGALAGIRPRRARASAPSCRRWGGRRRGRGGRMRWRPFGRTSSRAAAGGRRRTSPTRWRRRGGARSSGSSRTLVGARLCLSVALAGGGHVGLFVFLYFVLAFFLAPSH